ncbi:MAG TPA: glucan 1,4-alpha-glucosidase, partial [Acidobacteriaceae bacterium]|nr:glucan 1,4-alpha-glucosidase [Acidobacteriaceae bacterium]
GTRKFKSKVEIFQTSRPVSSVAAGMTLRVVDTAGFNIVYSTDDWKTTLSKEARPVGVGYVADLDTVNLQGHTIAFTFYWPGQDKWLGRNIEVAVT